MDNGKDTSTLQELKDYNNFLVSQIFTRTTHDGITYLSNLFDISADLQAKIAQLAKFADTCQSGDGTWPAGFTWKARDSTDVAMTPKQMIDFNLAIGAFIKDATLNSITHTTSVNSMTDIPTLRAYDVTTGWPLETTDYTSVGSSKDGRVFSGNFPQQTGTTTIPHDNTVPLSTEGSQLMSHVVTPSSVNSKFVIRAQIPCDVSSNGAHITAAVFRDTTCIGVASLESATKGLVLLALANADGQSLNIRTTDSPATESPITYSIRIGTTAGTWFVNRTASATYGGVGSMGWSITEII